MFIVPFCGWVVAAADRNALASFLSHPRNRTLCAPPFVFLPFFTNPLGALHKYLPPNLGCGNARVIVRGNALPAILLASYYDLWMWSPQYSLRHPLIIIVPVCNHIRVK